MTRYQVTAPYIRVRTETPDGPRVVGLYAGELLPADVPDGWLAAHASQVAAIPRKQWRLPPAGRETVPGRPAGPVPPLHFSPPGEEVSHA